MLISMYGFMVVGAVCVSKRKWKYTFVNGLFDQFIKTYNIYTFIFYVFRFVIRLKCYGALV